MRNTAAFKSVVGTLCATKTVINDGKAQTQAQVQAQAQAQPRPQRVAILPAAATATAPGGQRANLPVRLPVTTASQQGVLRVPVNLKAVLPKPSPTAPIRYAIATRDSAVGQFHVPNILTRGVKGDERAQTVQARVKPDHIVSTLVPQLGAPVAVAIANGPDASPDTNAAVSNDKCEFILIDLFYRFFVYFLTLYSPAMPFVISEINPEGISSMHHLNNNHT